MDTKEIIEEFIKTRTLIHDVQAPNKSGVYAIYLKDLPDINGLQAGNDGLIYIGSTSDLARREFENHFSSQSTGFSTLRRSFGAILKENLRLEAIPRSPGPSETNVRNYKFLSDGEDRLTDWMKENLEVGICPISSDYESIEKKLLLIVRPILNLTGWGNPYRKEIKALRKICADEARRNRSS